GSQGRGRSRRHHESREAHEWTGHAVSGDPEHTDSGVTGPADPKADRSAVPVVLNPTARRGAVLKRIDPLIEAFAAHGLKTRPVRSTSEEHAKELAAGFAAAGATLVVALGGDAMARAGAAVFVDRDTFLVIIACRRGNDRSGKLGIPKGTEGAVSNVAAVRDRIIDVLDFDGNLSLINVCLGVDSAVQRHAISARLIRGR